MHCAGIATFLFIKGVSEDMERLVTVPKEYIACKWQSLNQNPNASGGRNFSLNQQSILPQKFEGRRHFALKRDLYL